MTTQKLTIVTGFKYPRPNNYETMTPNERHAHAAGRCEVFSRLGFISIKTAKEIATAMGWQGEISITRKMLDRSGKGRTYTHSLTQG